MGTGRAEAVARGARAARVAKADPQLRETVQDRAVLKRVLRGVRPAREDPAAGALTLVMEGTRQGVAQVAATAEAVVQMEVRGRRAVTEAEARATPERGALLVAGGPGVHAVAIAAATSAASHVSRAGRI